MKLISNSKRSRILENTIFLFHESFDLQIKFLPSVLLITRIIMFQAYCTVFKKLTHPRKNASKN